MRQQFFKFFNNQLHQIYLIETKKKTGFYKARKLPFFHNEQFEKAVTTPWNVSHKDANQNYEIDKTKPQERGLQISVKNMDKRCYNILNFLKKQQIEMHFTDYPYGAMPKTIKSKENLLIHVRNAE